MTKIVALVWMQELLNSLYIVSGIAALWEILHLCSKEEMKQQCERVRQERYEREGEEWASNHYLMEIFLDMVRSDERKYWSEWRRKRMKQRLLILLTIVLKAAQLCLIWILAA